MDELSEEEQQHAHPLPRKVLVTGASRGIGKAVAQRLLDDGAQVALVARDVDALEQVAKAHSRAVALPADLQDPGQAAQLVRRTADVLGGIDGLVNCAGVVRYTRVGEVSVEELRLQLAINLEAPFLIGQQAAMRMISDGVAGSIVSVGSTLARHPARATSGYGASKAALEGMTRSFAHELAEHGIRVNALALGVVDTDMVRAPRPGWHGFATGNRARVSAVDRQLRELQELHPLGRLGTPDDVADSVLFLLRTPWMTGSVVTLDGGLSVA